MTDIVECIVAEQMAGQGGVASSKILPEVIVTGGTGSGQAFHTIGYLFVDGGVMDANLWDIRSDLLVSAGVLSEAVFQHADARDFMVVKGVIDSVIFSGISDLIADDSGVFSDDLFQSRVTSIIKSEGVLSDRIMPISIGDLISVGVLGAGRIMLRMHDLVVSAGVMGARIMPVRLRDMLVSAGAGSGVIYDTRITRDLLASGGVLGVAIFDHLHAVDLVVSEGVMEAAVIDELGISAWSAPTDTFAMTRYTLPALDSLATTGGAVIALGPDGAFRRAGTADDGDPFNAYIRTGLTDFGDAYIKRGDKAYAGYTSDGGVRLHVGETRTGVEQTWPYDLPARAAVTAPDAGRFDIGRGIETRYLRFTVSNVDGSAFALMGLEVDYLIISRRK